MDNNSTSIIPSLINTSNYRILKKVERTIAKEEELIRNQVLNHSKKAFKYQRKREHAIAKKRKIFGICRPSGRKGELFIDLYGYMVYNYMLKK